VVGRSSPTTSSGAGGSGDELDIAPHRTPIRYEGVGSDYGRTRRSDPRIAQRIRAGLGDAGSVVNVGAGLGAYEPDDIEVTAVEPAAAMVAARPATAAPCVCAAAESLPFADASFDAAMAVLTMQHWADLAAGLAELRRVARRRVVVFTWLPEIDDDLWLTRDYLPAIRERDRLIFPTVEAILAGLGPCSAIVEPVPVPHDCHDGFLGAFWRRPEAYLDPVVQAGISSFVELDDALLHAGLERLAADLASGAWRRRYAHLLQLDQMDLAYRLVTAHLPVTSRSAS
jgi:SAM-dependent methyltransferase